MTHMPSEIKTPEKSKLAKTTERQHERKRAVAFGGHSKADWCKTRLEKVHKGPVHMMGETIKKEGQGPGQKQSEKGH